jgi:hypothetical protein
MFTVRHALMHIGGQPVMILDLLPGSDDKSKNTTESH